MSTPEPITPGRPETLADAFPKQQARVRELLDEYKALRGMPRVNPEFAIACVEAVLRRADKAAAEHDTVAMLRAYEELKGCS